MSATWNPRGPSSMTKVAGLPTLEAVYRCMVSVIAISIINKLFPQTMDGWHDYPDHAGLWDILPGYREYQNGLCDHGRCHVFVDVI